jgi:hypothetical protein
MIARRVVCYGVPMADRLFAILVIASALGSTALLAVALF